MQFGSAAHENAAKHQTEDAVRVMLCVNEREGGAPRAPEHVPSFNAQVVAQRLDVANRSVGVVVLQFSIGGGLTAASLVKLNDVEGLGIEVLAVGRLGASTRSTVDDNHRDAVWVAALFPSDGVLF